MEPYEDPNHEANSPKHHTGKLCVEGCGRLAGTAWSPYWCQPCNAERMNRIGVFLERETERMEEKKKCRVTT